MTVAEGGGKRAITRKIRDVYVPTLKANYVLWPAVQIINFRFVPLQFQIVRSRRVSVLVAFLTSCYYSLLSLPLVSLGRHIYPSAMPRKVLEK